MKTQQSTEQLGVGQSLEQLSIGQLARLTRVSAKAIRYYESVGLLPQPQRRENGYRSYSQVDVNRLILLRRMRLLGVSFAATRSLLVEADDVRCAEVQQEVLSLVRDRLIALDQEIVELHLLRDQVEHYQEQLSACHPDTQTPFRDCYDLSCLAFSAETMQEEEEHHACPSCP